MPANRRTSAQKAANEQATAMPKREQQSTRSNGEAPHSQSTAIRTAAKSWEKVEPEKPILGRNGPGTVERTDDAVHANGSTAQPPVIQPAQHAYEPPVDLSTLSLEELSTSELVYNRELSWLDFNWRVLAEALDDRTPLLERLRFIAITASNLDEFFRKRVGGLKRQLAAGIANLTLQGWTPDLQLRYIAQAVRPMLEAQSTCLYEQLLPALAEHGIRIFDYEELSEEQRALLQDYYQREVYPILTPLAVDPGHPFPFISNLSLSLGVLLYDPSNEETHFARVKVPTNRPRWVALDTPNHFVPLEQVMLHNLDTLFAGMHIVAAHPFRLTRNADVERNEDEAEDLLDMINEELRERRFAPVVRLEVADSMPERMLAVLRNELHLDQNDVYPIRGLLRLDDFFTMADLNLPHLKYEPWVPHTPVRLAGLDNRTRPSEIFAVMRQGDLLVHHPYHSFAASTQQFVEAAARDPHVVAIKQTLYRTSANSPIIRALIQAAEQGKQVAVLVEVKARFDEAQNIEWARMLENAGCHVAYGLVGLKTHTKLSLVIREEDDGLRAYYHIGTGNYNAKTAELYTDLGIFSCNSELGADLMDLFNYLTGYSRQTDYHKLLVAPVNMRRHFIEMIEQEIQFSLAGRTARIIAKMNGLEDPEIVRKLYEASQAGVSIDLIVRGNCRIRPGIPGISENVRVISIIGRFLEHSRIFYFHNDGAPRYFIGSADWMQRNLSSRVEAVTPIEDPRLKEQIDLILQLSLADHRQSWEMLPDGRYRRRFPTSGADATMINGLQISLMHQARTTAVQLPTDRRATGLL
ncbi:MAG: polyphosphate kinase 1 [Caldilineaceae bacterium]|nr:polyphosphate kinase 1 [Caldilineaceae bacterium]